MQRQRLNRKTMLSERSDWQLMTVGTRQEKMLVTKKAEKTDYRTAWRCVTNTEVQ